VANDLAHAAFRTWPHQAERAELELPVAQRYAFREGKVTRWQTWLSWDEGLKAVGLEE
jgi:hypothetical protein